MLSFQTHSLCQDCSSAQKALDLVDKKLDALARIHYGKITHLSSRPLDLQCLRDLIHYKHMLQHLVFNPHYYAVSLETIISKVKTITL